MQPETERESSTVFAETFPKIPALIWHPVRCGKAGCRCNRGDLHGSWRMVWRGYDGRQYRRYVRGGDVDQVRQILTLRREQRNRERLAAWVARRELQFDQMSTRDLMRTLTRIWKEDRL